MSDEEDKNRQLTVVQAIGSINSSVGPEDALEVGRVLARRSRGSFLTLKGAVTSRAKPHQPHLPPAKI